MEASSWSCHPAALEIVSDRPLPALRELSQRPVPIGPDGDPHDTLGQFVASPDPSSSAASRAVCARRRLARGGQGCDAWSRTGCFRSCE